MPRNRRRRPALRNRLLALATIAIAWGAATGGVALASGTDRSANGAPPLPPASEFSARVDNPWYPLRPGTTYVYTGVKDGQPSRDVLTVTRRTRTIGRVPCVVVEDRLYVRGRLRERTTDWYSQDASGNVWYFGEETAELDARGRVTSRKGSWLAGADGAQPGVFMPARPRVGQSFRQEYYRGEAEDHFEIIGLFGAVTGAAETNALLTREWTPLEPDVIDHKLYVRGIGTVLEQTEKGGDERFELVSVTRAR